MRKPAKSRRYAAARRGEGRFGETEREQALLDEFRRSESVAALAARIAQRLGRRTRSEDLIADAGLVAAKQEP